MVEQWNHKIFGVKKEGFEALALEIFRFQYGNNPVYRDYVNALRVDPAAVQHLRQIPFLPISLFKTGSIQATLFEPQMVFESSGTTGMTSSRHLVKDLSIYEESFIKGFEQFYGSVKDWCIIGLLPSYLERKNSSLVYMVDKLIRLGAHAQSGFYLDEYDKLLSTLKESEQGKQKTLLIGVTFALLDFAEKFLPGSFPEPLHFTTVMETGGMKGRREEILREELHARLQTAFHLPAIHSEYGMTELLSQAYSKENGIFYTPAWMKILVRDDEDPFLINETGSGAINVIDLANIYSCCFIATDDAGRVHEDKGFEVLGRIDGSDLRGCSLLVV
jgi:phenylacetate-coenzyme A ligase PaaK-like adenylate-forming protein